MKTKKDLVIPYTWEERRPVFIDRMFYVPKLYDHETVERIDFKQMFGNDNPVFMEICSGNGQWIGAQARANPNINWVAVEMMFDRARMIWLKIHREKIPNLFVVCAEGSAFLKHYAPLKSVAGAYVNFPDPWPKRRHEKKRLIQAPFLQTLHTIVTGTVTLATDDEPYHNQMVREFGVAGGWKNVPFDSTSYGDSFFANLWKAKGRNIYYIRYENAMD